MNSELLKSDLANIGKTNKKTPTAQAPTKESKTSEGGSLFDKLLKNNTPNKKIDQEIPNGKKEQTNQKELSTKIETNTKTTPIVTNTNKNIETPKLSLLDRMIQKNSNESNKETSDVTKDNQKIVKDLKQKGISKDNIVETNSVNEKKEQTNPKDLSSKIDTKTQELKIDQKKSVDTPKETQNKKIVDKPKDEKLEAKIDSQSKDQNIEIKEIKKETPKDQIPKDQNIEIKEIKKETPKDQIPKDQKLEAKIDSKTPLNDPKKNKIVEDPSGKQDTKIIKTISQDSKNINVKVDTKVDQKEILEQTPKNINESNQSTDNLKKDSMLDKIIDSNKNTIESDVDSDVTQVVKKSNLHNQKPEEISSEAQKNNSSMLDKIVQEIETKEPLKTKIPSNIDEKQAMQMNRYLQDQKRSKDMAAKSAQSEATKVLSEAKEGTDSVQKAAKILELNLEDASIEKENTDSVEKKIEAKKDDFVFKKSYNILNRLYLKENSDQAIQKDLVKENQDSEKTNTNEKSTTNEIKSVEMRVDKSSIEVFTSKIIASRQKAETFMSDLARQMYQNYKPPITAFRINLNPANLGSIAIMIKSNRSENSMSVSMNLNQANTYEVLNENRSTLQNAIAKNFTQESSISLDLAFSDGNSGEFESMYQEERKEFQNQENDTLVESEKEVEENINNTNYM